MCKKIKKEVKKKEPKKEVIAINLTSHWDRIWHKAVLFAGHAQIQIHTRQEQKFLISLAFLFWGASGTKP